MQSLQNYGMITGANTMNILSKDWQPSQAIMDKYKEVNHDRETKYFKHFYINNQYRRGDWDQEYCRWCDKQTNRKNSRSAVGYRSKRIHKEDSFYARVYSELQDK